LLRGLWWPLLLAALWLAASPADATTLVFASWWAGGQPASIQDPQQFVSDGEYDYSAFAFDLAADFTDTTLVISYTAASLPLGIPVHTSWSMDFFFNDTEWPDGLALAESSFRSGLQWTLVSPNHVHVSWDGFVRRGQSFVAEFRNASYVPEPATALSMLCGLAGLGVLGRRRRRDPTVMPRRAPRCPPAPAQDRSADRPARRTARVSPAARRQ
jgi:hypothetical protein